MKFSAQLATGRVVLTGGFVLASLCYSPVSSQEPRYDLPMNVAAFEQQIHVPYTAADGLPSSEVRQLGFDRQGRLLALTASGPARLVDEKWERHPNWPQGRDQALQSIRSNAALVAMDVDTHDIRDVARHGSEVAVAAAEGLFIGDGQQHWRMALPRHGAIRWAPLDVRDVEFDQHGRLWFACPQGVGYRVSEAEWILFTGAQGLPYNDFTCMAAGPTGVWFGTTNGAIRFIDGDFEFRQGRRWLLDNHVHDIAIDSDGSAWLATSAGVSHIRYEPTTLARKARWFEDEIDRYHRRTDFGYVNPAMLSEPGMKETAIPQATDNDGHFSGLYLAATSFAWAATKDPRQRQYAVDAFRSLNFLSTVTEGGSHPAPKGFIARAIQPTTGPDPNLRDNAENDRRRRDRDALWKFIDPRWPIDETGQWYWKCDSSSDELDGYFFAYGVYYDHVCESEQEKAEVREIVRSLTDHLIEHDYSMVDHDGKPTRWGHFSPKDMNQNEAWWVERGLNSYSVLSYLTVAYHVTGDQKYRDAFMELAIDHGFGMNGMTQPKVESGPGSFGQADDNMAFMNYYNLIRYETDPKLLSMFHNAIYYHWRVEKQERNPFFNFVYAACCLDRVRQDQWRKWDLSPPKPWLEDGVDTLKRYPLDLVDWPMSNAHRIDMIPLAEYTRGPNGAHQGKGHRVDGHVFRIDEQPTVYWGDDPWNLTNESDGTRLREGVSYLLAYYMGLAHGYIAESKE